MVDNLKAIFIWISGLAFAPKLIISFIVIGVAILVVILIWQPDQKKITAKTEAGTEIGKTTESDKLLSMSKKYLSSKLVGTVSFDYSNNNGNYRIGEHPYDFETHWSKASDTSIHIYNDPPSIKGVGVAYGVSTFSEIGDASSIDMSSRSRTPQEGEFVVVVNSRGYYAALKIVDIKDRKRSDKVDEVSFEYIILPDRLNDFSHADN